MNTSNLKFTTASYIGLIFLFIIFGSIFTKDIIFDYIISFTGANQIEESQAATAETANLLLSLDKISLDTGVLQSAYLQSLVSLPSFPIDARTLSNFGKSNPFLGNFIVVPAKASSTVGAVIYSNQRSVNNGESIVPVSTTRR